MACNISNLARHTCIASIDLTNFYKRHFIPLIANVLSNNQPDANPPPFNRLYPELNARLHYEAIPN